jgi:large subunit ribosomal protein L21
MYAVIKTGGKQYRVAKDDTITIEKLEAAAGDTVAFPDVLMLGGNGTVEIGKPTVKGATVAGEVVRQDRADKVIVFKKRRRKNYRRKKGHRQDVTVVRITDILTGGAVLEMRKGEARALARGSVAGGKAFRFLKSPDGKADDLTLISGIGPKLNERLKTHGIFHFWQLASLADEDVKKLETDMAFPGRIDREEWIEQARELVSGGAPRAAVDRARHAGGKLGKSFRAFKRLDAPEGEASDLTLIAGVGDKIAEQLNAQGIFHFWQIAALEPHQLDQIEKEIGFKGRIRREQWIEQAIDLMQGKEPRAKVDQDKASKD